MHYLRGDARYMTSSADRERLWDAESERSKAFGWGDLPQCNICRCPVGIGQDWDVSHDGVPKALGGTAVGIAHRRCNREDGHQVTRVVAKAKRQARKHKGAFRTAEKLPCGRASRFSKKLNGEVVERLTLGQNLARMREARRIG